MGLSDPALGRPGAPHPEAAAHDNLGGKAAGLVHLQSLGAQVPPFACLPATAMADELTRCQALDSFRQRYARLVQRANEGDQAAVEEGCARLQQSLLALPASPTLRDWVAQAVCTLGPGPYAVRSSMVGEDSADASFAGQLETALFQRTEEQVLQAVRSCWASGLAARVLAYRSRLGVAAELPAVGVVVQVMVDGEVSGVCFTAHPTTGERDRCLVTAAWGLGEGVVDGSCNTDEWVVPHASAPLACQIADKDVAIRAAQTGTQSVEVPADRRHVPCLSDEQVAAIARQCESVAAASGSPQDIEWTIVGDELYLLQSRPITNLPVPANTDGPKLVFDNSNIQESYCGVTTPLTFSFASRAYESVYTQTAQALGVPRQTIERFAPVLRNLLGLVRGRVYYNINNWYRALQLLPSFRRNKADMEKMMGLEDPVDFIEDESVSLWAALGRVPSLLRTGVRMLWAVRGLETTVPRWLARFEREAGAIDRSRFADASFSELMGWIKQVDERLLGHWHTPIVNDCHVMMATGQLRRAIEGAGFEDTAALEASLLGGEEGLESVEPTRALLRIAASVREDSAAEALVRAPYSAGTPEALRQAAPAIADAVDAYIERYGDRVIGELKLESISLRENPRFVFDVIRNYLDRPELSADNLAEHERGRREEAEAKLREASGRWARRRLPNVLRQARQAVRNREAMRLSRTRMFGLYRDLYLALGQRLVEAQVLSSPRDVLYLAVEELEAYHEGRAVSAALGPIAQARRQEYEGYEAQELPHRFETVGPVYHGNRYSDGSSTPVDLDATTLSGTGCCAGIVESEAKVILNATDELSVDGKILVTLRTDPGWAPLFPTCSGLLVERGSTLSHSAVVARELSIPAVVGIPGLLAQIENGEPLRMDGERGVVERLGQKA